MPNMRKPAGRRGAHLQSGAAPRASSGAGQHRGVVSDASRGAGPDHWRPDSKALGENAVAPYQVRPTLSSGASVATGSSHGVDANEIVKEHRSAIARERAAAARGENYVEPGSGFWKSVDVRAHKVNVRWLIIVAAVVAALVLANWARS